ncbi:MAG: hypothetical protein LQ351_006400 [Letrouitia transgressa]|nr:MAG: hypothetical protein LQ351_006400 [Letrouitia transgressa]
MANIEEKLEPSVLSEGVRSTALWAEAGIGKTQIALVYVNRRRRDGLEAIFWIPSEDESETVKSFTEIAETLKLTGATTPRGHDQNRLLVLRWLQQTKSNWLIVYDNVDDQMLLSRIWPSCGRGSILVTCRSELLAASSSASSIAVPPFNSDDGDHLLLQELGQDQYTTRDLQLAVEFSQTLGVMHWLSI